MKLDIIEIDTSNIPYYFDITLAGEIFRLDVNYNETAELFTIGLYKKNVTTGDYTEICASEPVIYGVQLWKDVYKSGKYPAVTIIPYDESGENNAVTFDNLNRNIFLMIADGLN